MSDPEKQMITQLGAVADTPSETTHTGGGSFLVDGFVCGRVGTVRGGGAMVGRLGGRVVVKLTNVKLYFLKCESHVISFIIVKRKIFSPVFFVSAQHSCGTYE